MAGTSSTEASKETVREFVEALNRGNLDGLADDYTEHDLAYPGGTSTREEIETKMAQLSDALSDLTLTIEDMVAEGETVAVRWSARGTHEGELMGMEPTGREVSLQGMNFVHVEDGKIAEDWVLWDSLGMMQQLGIGPEPPAP